MGPGRGLVIADVVQGSPADAAGLNKDTYNLIAWGRADTEPRCASDSPACLERNRRTTIKVRFDSSRGRRNDG